MRQNESKFIKVVQQISYFFSTVDRVTINFEVKGKLKFYEAEKQAPDVVSKKMAFEFTKQTVGYKIND